MAGDEICTRANRLIDAVPQPVDPAAVEPYLRQLIAIYRGEVEELRALADQTGDPQWSQLITALTAYFDRVEADLSDLAQDPSRMNAPGSPTGQALADARKQAEALGLRVCGASGSGSSSATTQPGG